jgi:hypothetical protein
MTDKLDDVWASRDFPVLREIARLVDSGDAFPHKTQIVQATGLSPEQVTLAALALRRRGLIDFTQYAGGDFSMIKEISGSAYFITGLHPSGDDAISSLIDALRQAEESVDDPEEKTLLRRAGGAIGSVSQNVMGQVLAAYIKSQAGI